MIFTDVVLRFHDVNSFFQDLFVVPIAEIDFECKMIKADFPEYFSLDESCFYIVLTQNPSGFKIAILKNIHQLLNGLSFENYRYFNEIQWSELHNASDKFKQEFQYVVKNRTFSLVSF